MVIVEFNVSMYVCMYVYYQCELKYIQSPQDTQL